LVPLDPTQDFESIQAVVLQAVSEHPKVLKAPPPEAPLDSFAQCAMNIAVQAWVPTAGFSASKDDLVKRVQVALRKAGIRFAQPYRAEQQVPAGKG
jgi:small conductance mechanosensitive channel